MKLYRISQSVNNDYDTYNAFVVCAENEENAKHIKELDKPDEHFGSWVSDPKDIFVEYLGKAKTDFIKEEIILESFRAR